MQMYNTQMNPNMFNPYGMSMGSMNQYYNGNVINAGIPKVTGIDGAKAYQMGANQSVALFDANDNLFYLKTTDSAGFASYRTFRFEEVAECEVKSCEGVSRAEFEELKRTVEGLVSVNG